VQPRVILIKGVESGKADDGGTKGTSRCRRYPVVPFPLSDEHDNIKEKPLYSATFRPGGLPSLRQ